MRNVVQHMLAVSLVVLIGGTQLMAVEEAKYEVVTREKNFEIRDYEFHIVAETTVDGSLEDAGNKAFRRLFGYISGKNRLQTKIAMTAPVSQEAQSQKIAMTAPVAQERSADGWTVTFMMPAGSTLATLPAPTDPKVALREIPGRRMAAARYSGRWTEKGFIRHRELLEAWMTSKNLKASGSPVWARYNPPFMPSFLRRNEVLIPVGTDAHEDQPRE